MAEIEIKIGGNELAKILHYYGFSPDDEKIICPFHEDVNPSMNIDIEKGTFYCFGCGATGNAYNFVHLAEKTDDLESYKKYFKILKSKKVKNITVHRVAKHKPDDKQALIIAEDYYYGLKTIDWINSTDEDVLDVKKYMIGRGFTSNILNKCKAKITYNKSYPIIFPMMDNGEFKGWVCRTNLKRIEKRRKYLYNEGFSRRTTLCGTYKSETVVLVEGYMDMLKFKQFGLKNVAAILGWKITAEQIGKLKKSGVKYIISGLDNDKCGKKGTKYLMNFFNVIPFQYPEGTKDAGELDKQKFDIAYRKTKNKFKKWRQQNGNSR